jgi:iron complex transport system ATP-binding protein
MSRGRIAAAGAPREVITDELMEDVFGCALKVSAMPAAGQLFVLPQSVAMR